MKQVDLNDWVLNGAGYFGKSYFHKTDDTVLLKMMSKDFPVSSLEEEYRLATIVYGMGIPTPKPGELVTDGCCCGLTYERMADKVSFARAVGQTPEKTGELAVMFARMVKLLHTTKCNPECPYVKDVYSYWIGKNSFRSEAFKNRALDLLYSLPDGDTCLHGDLHFGNAIISKGKGYFIDLGSFSRGYPLFDMGMMMGILSFGEAFPDFFEENYHCTVAQGRKFWHSFLREYFGQDVDIAAKEKELIPYLALRQVCVEPMMGKPLPEEDCGPTFTLFR